MTMMTMMTVIDNVVDHYTYQTRWGQKRTHAKIHPVYICIIYIYVRVYLCTKKIQVERIVHSSPPLTWWTSWFPFPFSMVSSRIRSGPFFYTGFREPTVLGPLRSVSQSKRLTKQREDTIQQELRHDFVTGFNPKVPIGSNPKVFSRVQFPIIPPQKKTCVFFFKWILRDTIPYNHYDHLG